MKTNARFIASITATARSTEVQLPWARGARRAAMIARRKAQTTAKSAQRQA